MSMRSSCVQLFLIPQQRLLFFRNSRQSPCSLAHFASKHAAQRGSRSYTNRIRGCTGPGWVTLEHAGLIQSPGHFAQVTSKHHAMTTKHKYCFTVCWHTWSSMPHPTRAIFHNLRLAASVAHSGSGLKVMCINLGYKGFCIGERKDELLCSCPQRLEHYPEKCTPGMQ